MLIVQVHMQIKAECVDAFRQATVENARNSLLEPGIARFDLLEHAEDPHRFELVEAYRTEEAMAAHKLTAHYNKWAAAVADMFAEPRTRSRYNSVFPPDSDF
jgi:quinol monooxygenase YgiN